ncbi:MAG TPA: asparagine synthase-related protein [Gemmatimonadales bacterium]|nr:asparagine synthase-related protein [Gemmatimonadales bacterium]
MSAIAAIVQVAATAASPAKRQELEQQALAMVRASARADVPPVAATAATGPSASVAAAARSGAGENTLLAAAGKVCVAADASLVQRVQLAGELRRTGARLPAEPDDAQLLLAAWQAWGEGMVRRVEGDIALVLWDADRMMFVAWRDHVGRRPLHWAQAGDQVVAGSTPGVLLANPNTPRGLSAMGLAAIAAGLLEHPDETAWSDIRILPPGHLLTWSPGAPVHVRRVWDPPAFEQGAALPFQDARSELRRLLVSACAERMDSNRSTAVWMSGGWDSPAVYGAARAARAGEVFPVSMSYPKRDSGREDETIRAIAQFHKTEVHWASVNDAPLVMGDSASEQPDEDGPLVHPYRWWNRRMADVTVAAGAHTALDGAGGDQLFGLTPIFIAELLRRGRIVEARRAARAHGIATRPGKRGWMDWWQWGIRPLLPPFALQMAGFLRAGSAPLGHLERAVPAWFTQREGLRSGLRQRARGWKPRRGESLGAAESRWYLTSAYAGRILAAQYSAALAGGVVLRSPLLDSRIVSLAATRPRVERAAGGETKRLLRSAAAEWLPSEVLAKRHSRTGLSTDYFRRELRMSLPGLLQSAGEMDALAGMGLVDPTAVAAAAADWLAGRAGDEQAMALLYTLRTELWARAWSG